MHGDTDREASLVAVVLESREGDRMAAKEKFSWNMVENDDCDQSMSE